MRLVLDAGALIAVERRTPAIGRELVRATVEDIDLVTHGGIVGQVWRGGGRQAQLARLLRAVDVAPLDDSLGRRAGLLLARSGTEDVVDAALVALCEDGDEIYTSDPEDIVRLARVHHAHVEVVPI